METLPNKALLTISAADEATVYLNGHEVARAKDYTKTLFWKMSVTPSKGHNISPSGLKI